MMKPTIHLNGTSRATLTQTYMEAGIALNAAIDALAETAPNGRDYYPQGNGATGQATAEYLTRIERLSAVRDELLELYNHCDDEPRS